MRLVRPSIEFLDVTENPLEAIERAGRTCYKSEDKICAGSAAGFVKKLLDRGHHAMIEHAWMSYRVVCDRGVTHEIVRHRLFSYAQESTRYCDYRGGVTFVIPCWLTFPEGNYCNSNNVFTRDHGDLEKGWLFAMFDAEECYKRLLKGGWSPQQARGVLPNSLKTEIVMTGDLREWRHFFSLRTAKAAHPQMQEVAKMLLADARERVPVVFEEFAR